MLIDLALGLVVGLILALTGAGGGILAVPLLVFGAQLGVAEAGPIGLLAVGMAAALGALLGLKAGMVRYRAALLIAAAGMLVSPVGLWLARHTDNRWLSILFGFVLLYVALNTFLHAKKRGPASPERGNRSLPPPCVRDVGTRRFVWSRSCARALALTGTLSGLLSGLLGVGGGFVIVPALQRYTDLAMTSIVATSLAVIALVSASAVAVTGLAGAMNWAVAIPFSAGAVAGMLGGRMASARLARPELQIAFAAVSAAIAIGMVGKSVT